MPSHSNPSTRPPILGRCVVFCFALVSLTMVGLPSASASDPHGTFTVIEFGITTHSQFLNYDSTGPNNYLRTNADWPVTTVFAQNAEVDKVKDILRPQYHSLGGVIGLPLLRENGSSWTTDTDRGMKNNSGTCPTNQHMRIYADSTNDRLWTYEDGYFVLGTAHWDVYEDCAGSWFGSSESAANFFHQLVASKGYTTYYDIRYMMNYEAPRWETTARYWDSDGYATQIQVP